MLIRPLFVPRLGANAWEGHQLYTSQRTIVSRPPSLRRSHLPRFSPNTRGALGKSTITAEELPSMCFKVESVGLRRVRLCSIGPAHEVTACERLKRARTAKQSTKTLLACVAASLRR